MPICQRCLEEVEGLLDCDGEYMCAQCLEGLTADEAYNEYLLEEALRDAEG